MQYTHFVMGLTSGGRVRIRQIGGDWCDATVLLLSPNGKSAPLELNGALRVNGGIMLNVCPVLTDDDAETVTGLMGEEYEIEVAGGG
jgi:hypothetical protein